MIEIEDKKNCCGCHACFNICPQNAILMIEDENGFKIPKIDKRLCVNCGLCEKVCPIIKDVKIENEPEAYAMYNIDEQNRKNSSSGGIFSLLSKEILHLNGVVFGAKFNDKFEVEHDFIENEESLYMFMSSKYVQSTIGDNYKKVKDFLENGRYVLFSGTPCQIEGLKAFLNKDYARLYTQDIICHGVPSPMVWKKYLEYREEKDGKKPQEINFRNKEKGWKEYETYFKYNDGEYRKNHKNDYFMNTFLSNLCLRESCYDCKFKKKNRISDITLGDFWGIDKVISNFSDNKGVSLVIVNSIKGKELFEKIKCKCKFEKTDLNEAIKYNPSMIKSSEKPKNRKVFLERIKSESFELITKQYVSKKSIIKRIKIKVKNILSN